MVIRDSGWAKLSFSLAVAVAALVLVYWLSTIILLTFAGVILAVLFGAIADFLKRTVRLPRSAGLVTGALLFVILLGVGVSLLIFPLMQEGTQFVHSMPERTEKLTRKFETLRQQMPWLDRLIPGANQNQSTGPVEAGRVVKQAAITVWTALDWLTQALATFFLGIFFAWNPKRWMLGVAQLWPGPNVNDRVELMSRIGDALRNYLIAYGLYIVIMGTCWAVGLWLIGIPYFLIFGVIGGLVEVAPYVGPVIGLIPPLIVAMGISATKVIWVLALYAILHIIEGYLLVPYVMHQKEHLPPPVIILSVMAFGTLFGALGVTLAIPLGTFIYVVLQETYYSKRLHVT